MLRFCAVIRGSVTRYHRHSYEIHFHFITRHHGLFRKQGSVITCINSELQFNSLMFAELGIIFIWQWNGKYVCYFFLFLFWYLLTVERNFHIFVRQFFFLKRSFEISITFIINFKVSVFRIILFIKYESGIFFVDKIKFETEYRYQKIAKHEQAKFSLVRSFDVTLIDLTIC